MTQLGIKYFVAGEFEKSIQAYSDAINLDSTDYENYYFRAIAITYTTRDTSSLDDFFNSVRLKTKYSKQTDTTFISGFFAKPSRRQTICGPSLLHDQSDTFFDVMLATWYLNNNETGKACILLNDKAYKKFDKLKKFRKKYCT